MVATNGTVNGGLVDAETASAADAPVLGLQRIRRTSLIIPIRGESPLISHKFSEKAKREMREKQQGAKARAKKDAKEPEQEAHDATYWLERPDGVLVPAMPAVSFKAAIVGAARLFEGVTMTELRRSVFVHGIGPEQLVPIEATITMREDTVRIGMGTVDLRYRNQLWPWETTIQVEYVPSLIDPQSVVALVDAAGMGGIGEWRPSSPKSNSGTYGRFHVDDSREIRQEEV